MAAAKLRGFIRIEAPHVVHCSTPCMGCQKVSSTPVEDLLLDVAMMKQVGGAAAAAAVPLCDMCEHDAATQYCMDCYTHKYSCDECRACSHRAKKTHAHVPIREHLASQGSAAGAVDVVAAITKVCGDHPGYPLHIFCNSCDMLICAMCGSLNHHGHGLQPVREAFDAQRAALNTRIEAVAVARAGVIAAIKEIKIVKAQLEPNKDKANTSMLAGIKLLELAAKEGNGRPHSLGMQIRDRKVALELHINETYNSKDDLLNDQITALEDLEDNDNGSGAALELVRATLAAATPFELFERMQLFEGGLRQFAEHKVPLKAKCTSLIEFVPGSLEISNPDTSTAVGQGIRIAYGRRIATFVVVARILEIGEEQHQRSAGGDKVEAKLVRAGAPNKEDAPGVVAGEGAAADEAFNFDLMPAQLASCVAELDNLLAKNGGVWDTENITSKENVLLMKVSGSTTAQRSTTARTCLLEPWQETAQPLSLLCPLKTATLLVLC